ncbi:C40 family peptidase [Nonomuraea soli]|uniref:Cell wall-associated NlpC family hydrolase n=1 Tax=Nonomuraea soli TaxID=1032476 RepID=A0A7W0CUJ0_9ACTN|nr:NlpC/P60 family protein [Nonomuraea soli]MBA2897438.1 cell wall-associated NlpC family hydrolase [Nonomuraea soli]
MIFRALPGPARHGAAARAGALAVLLLTAASAPVWRQVDPAIVTIAYELEKRDIVYSWGGGHASRPGPSRGTCLGYRGKIKPCPAAKTRGLDCSGFVRWVYALAHGTDVLGPGTTDDHIAKLRKAAIPRPGDLVFFGKNAAKTSHVGIYLGSGEMMNAPETGAKVRIDKIATKKGLIGFYRL